MLSRQDLYILDADNRPVPCPDLIAFGLWFQTHETQIALNIYEAVDGEIVRVSTIFLGVDYGGGIYSGQQPPVLWETMIFGGPLDLEGSRYTSHADALAGHQAMCARVTAALQGVS